MTDNQLVVNNATTYTYDDAGNLEIYTYGNGVKHAYTYNSLNRLTDSNVTRLGSSVNSYSYQQGAAGNREGMTESDGRQVSYTYDALYRLKSETIAGDAGGINGRTDYDYDDIGNRLGRTSTLPASRRRLPRTTRTTGSTPTPTTRTATRGSRRASPTPTTGRTG